jgi:hypothetical protein
VFKPSKQFNRCALFRLFKPAEECRKQNRFNVSGITNADAAEAIAVGSLAFTEDNS